MIRRSSKLEYDLVSFLERDPLLRERLRRACEQFPASVRSPLSYGPWRSATTHGSVPTGRRSATADCALMRRARPIRMPLSKQRNKHIQRVLVEAAKLGAEREPKLRPNIDSHDFTWRHY